MEIKKYSRVCAEISLDAIDHNIEVMKNRLTEGTSICAVIKADAYGHGALQIARRLGSNPAVWGFACATSDEAASLRRNGITKPVILLGYTFEECYEDILTYDLRPCLFDTDSARRLSLAAQAAGKTVRVHLAVDTGMGRIGFFPDEAAAREAEEISRLPGLEIEGLFTHFARADEPSGEPAEIQFSKYEMFRKMLQERGIRPAVCHVSNSAALMRFRQMNLDLVRAGITLYGLMPSGEVASEMGDLMPVMTIRSHVSYVKTLPAGSPVSYGGTYVTGRETRIATIPVGYADGYPRGLSNKGYVLIHGQKAPVTGRVCMDQFMVDVSGIPGVKTGDEVVLLGTQEGERITAEELGDLSGRFNYELVCCISRRVPRNYTEDGRIVEQVDYFR